MAACVDGSCQLQRLTREDKRKDYDHHVANAHETWQGLRDDLIRIGHQYFDYAIDVADIEETLHDAWDELIYAAKIIPPGSSEHDRLVTLILELREFGPFVRNKQDGNGQEAAVLPNGERLWTDLPYFIHDLQQFWAKESMELSAAERESFAVFTAKLCASGAFAQDLACCALPLFREALETENLWTSSYPERGYGNNHIALADGISACAEWLAYANFNFARLSVANSTSTVPREGFEGQRPSSLGELAKDAGVEGDGFSLQRWLFWRQRFGELYLQGDEKVSKPARKSFELMISAGGAIGLNISGEKRFLEQAFKALDTELAARGFNGCVTLEEIKMDPNWANES